MCWDKIAEPTCFYWEIDKFKWWIKINSGNYCNALTTLFFPGKELTYRGHAGLGRPIPAPFCMAKPLPAQLLLNTPGSAAGSDRLIQPKKVRGTPTMYADLQFPVSSNCGSMRRRIDGTGNDTNTEYVRIKFNPGRAERADLWHIVLITVVLANMSLDTTR